MARSRKEAFRLMYDLDEDQEILRETIAEYVDEKMIPRREELDKQKVFPRWFYNDMVEMGVTSVIIPEEYDGLGAGLFDVGLVIEEIGRGCAGAATSLGATFLGIDPVLYFGTEEQKKKYLPLIVDGEVAAFALTEPDAGSDAGGLKTIAEKIDDNTYSLKGQKTYITNGGVASIYTVFASTDKSRGPRGVSGFVFEIDPENPPKTIEFPTKFDKMGINASETREIIFDGFQIPKENLIGGKEGRGFLHTMGTFDITRPMIGIIGVGIARAALEEAHRYTHERIQFGKKIISFRALQEMFVDMITSVDAARALIFDVSRSIDQAKKVKSKKDITGLSGIAKVIGSEVGRITLDALQATGGYGYMNETPFPKLVRDFKIFEIFEGTNQIQREQISLQLIKEFKKGGWADAALAEAQEAHELSSQCGAACQSALRRLFSTYLDWCLNETDSITDDQYRRFMLADCLIEIETAHSFCKAVAKIKDNDPNDFSNLCARIYSQETAQKVTARLKKLVLGVGGQEAFMKLDEIAPISDIDRLCTTLLDDRKALGEWLSENRIS